MSLPPEVVFRSSVDIQAMTDVGRYRAHNEDNFIVCPDLSQKRWCLSDHPAELPPQGCLLVVADGMGGANAGEVASAIAVETIKNRFDLLEIEASQEEEQIQRYIAGAIMEAHEAIVAASAENPDRAGMGTTIVVAWVFPEKAVMAWVGDSRAYRFSKQDGLKLLTNDHSLVWELVMAGKLTPDEADIHPDSNIITQSLGAPDRLPRPDFTTCALKPGDRLLLCSDGLNNMLSHKAIEQILAKKIPLSEAGKKLIDAANEEGGDDNITVLSLELLEKPPKKNFFNLFGLLSV
ncbi:Stp1/IreP family PP2C-type Ser/Thr phosphatase [Cesiribacter sp. SM1]|uniref:Stp1/IreP family PP2C-type Ser/Thr phosphatase n=1 Tax=Cesiribacter sp. SM1 TaxID=2861196 RepID=UPI001CD5D34F|nr:Stp1/IreP family PP2C-type Ser/Thr phosphatase [Cesiribacter sp. SM1]